MSFRRRIRVFGLGLAAATVAVTGAPTTAAAEPSERSTAPVFNIADLMAGQPRPVGSSTVVRTDRGISARVATSELSADHAVTLWWGVFNDPASCEAGMPGLSRCGPADHLAGRGGVSVLHAAGRIVRDDGTANYGAHLRRGATARALDGDGLVDVTGAEVILVLRTHGPKIPELTSDQLRTFAGACNDQSDVPDDAPPELVGAPGPNDCTEVQISVHRPEAS